MARLSGLASDNQSQGDGQRRRRGRKSTTTIEKVEKVEMTKQVTSVAGTKRTASPSVEVQARRSKRQQLDDHDQLSREQDESASRSQTPGGLLLPALRNRRYSDPSGAHDDQADELAGNAPSFKDRRRARMSMPAQLHVTDMDETDGVRQVQFAPLREILDRHSRLRLRRNHLSEEQNKYESHKKEDAKLRQDVREMKELIREYELQLEGHRLGQIDMSDDQTVELQEQLEKARQEIDELRSSPFAPADIDDDDELMLVEPQELGLSQDQMRASPLPNGVHASRVLRTSQITVDSLSEFPQTTQDTLMEASQDESTIIPDKISDQAVKRYEAEMASLLHRLADAQGALRCITLELQNLNIVAPGPSANQILTELRHVLEESREEYEHLFSRSIVGLTNAEFIKTLVDDLKGVNEELLQKTILAEKQHQRIALVQSEYESTMGLLAESEDRNEKLQEKEHQLEELTADQQQQIGDLEEHLRAVSKLADERREQIDEKDASLNGLKDELNDKETGLERITKAMNQYREEVNTLTETVTRLEKEHATRITELESDHAAVVQDLETQLENEQADRVEAENVAQENADTIDSLEKNLDSLEIQINETQTQVTELTQRLAEEEQAREQAETERDENAETAYQHSVTIENLNETIRDLDAQITQFRANLDAERSQRQQTEADLDEANEKIEALEHQVHDQGLQANELRSKLFQLQQEREDTVAALKADAKASEEEYEELLTAETEHRATAEQEVVTLQTRISELEQDLTNVESALADTRNDRETVIADRDEQIQKLDRQLEDLHQKHSALQSSTQSSIDTLQSTITDLTNEVNGLRATISGLEIAATETAELHAGEIAERNEVIAGLETDLDVSRKENRQLLKENKSLSTRVEHEAQELLHIMGSHTQKEEALRATIATQTAHIAELQAAAQQKASEHDIKVSELVKEIEERTIIGQTRVEHITELAAQLEELRERFLVQAEDSQNTISTLLEKNRRNMEEQDQIAAGTQKRTADHVKAVNEMKIRGLQVHTTGVNLKKVVNGKVTKVNDKVKISKKKSFAGRFSSFRGPRDSGIDLEQELDGETEVDEGVAA